MYTKPDAADVAFFLQHLKQIRLIPARETGK
jgi:hypothetical protein